MGFTLSVNTNPLVNRFATQSPIIHTRQSTKAGGGTDSELCLELAFREREPTGRSVVAALRESVAYWAHHTKTGCN